AKVIHAECWSHTRRGFEAALDAEPQSAREALALIGAIDKEEAWIRKKRLEGPKKLAARRERCEPRVRAFWGWCDEQCRRTDLLPS
ncbi:MAG: transposase, partial [Gammaproteobacteria bacterium]|nr:transposase [Gammaproteobacteria bacterium]NIR82152.1 transposase [Gammaproteobacteria bacterium]NIU04049.1 transposase [Gammaproteobacteria bacterium]NIV75690.1 transposase [Gammaproteobacteria bacterium]NIX85323.1 transposase [Gammaproteobacteria bacterium]